ncbi:MAG: hypothetical protein JW787_08305 [Sedimentisphaerales bacterium]|nr:hypothetical protein [Sedimentisphaerales bacterium]
MTPEQLILLIETSAKQYTCMEAKINATGYVQEERSSQQIVQVVSEIHTRWSQDKEYWKISRTTYPTAEQPKTHEEVVTYAFTPQQTKKLTEEPGKTPRGLVRFGNMCDADKSFYTIHSAMWEHCDILWKKLHDQRDMTLKYDKIRNLYEFKVQTWGPGDLAYIFYVDPSRNFIPVKKDIFSQAGLLKHIECDQFQKNNNVWIPYRYSWTEPQQNWMECYEVEKVSANVPIEDRLFDFDFPAGTIIIDEMAYLKQKFKVV